MDAGGNSTTSDNIIQEDTIISPFYDAPDTNTDHNDTGNSYDGHDT